jgi:hypothetical protein
MQIRQLKTLLLAAFVACVAAQDATAEIANIVDVSKVDMLFSTNST